MRPAGEVAMLIIRKEKAERQRWKILSISEADFNVKRRTKRRR